MSDILVCFGFNSVLNYWFGKCEKKMCFSCFQQQRCEHMLILKMNKTHLWFFYSKLDVSSFCLHTTGKLPAVFPCWNFFTIFRICLSVLIKLWYFFFKNKSIDPIPKHKKLCLYFVVTILGPTRCEEKLTENLWVLESRVCSQGR